MRFGKKLRRALLIILLAAAALVVWVPLWMLLAGSLMGEAEILQNLSPIPRHRQEHRPGYPGELWL